MSAFEVIQECERLNASGIVCIESVMNSENLEWSFQKPTEFFSESCVL